MNETLAAIYGTSGDHEKVASIIDPSQPATLSDLALVLAAEEMDVDLDNLDADAIEKVASMHEETLQRLLDVDRAGRAAAHSEFNAIEKQAAETGDYSVLEEFLSDDDELAGEAPAQTDLQRSILEEVSRRLQS